MLYETMESVIKIQNVRYSTAQMTQFLLQKKSKTIKIKLFNILR